MSALLAAFLLASLIANVSLFLFPYDWKREQSPPGEYSSQQPNGQQSETKQRTPAIRIQVECDPECSAKRSYESGVESWLKKYLQKVRDDPVGGFTGLLFVATLLLAHMLLGKLKIAALFGALTSLCSHLDTDSTLTTMGPLSGCDCGSFSKTLELPQPPT